MKAVLGWMLAVLIYAVPVSSLNALEIQGTAGYGWQSWSTATEDRGTFFSNPSFDGANLNVGYYMTQSGGWSSGSGPGVALDYWGGAGGMYDPNFYFASAGGESATFMAELTFRDGLHTEVANKIGWFEIGAGGTIGTMHLLFDSSMSNPDSSYSVGFTPTPFYGFYIANAEGTYYTLTGGLGFQHFAVFREDDYNYWIGVEDLVKLATTTRRPYAKLTDSDYNDLVLRITSAPVPDGGATAALLGLGIAVSGFLRKKIR